MAVRYRLTSSHAEDLACGQVLAPGEESSRVNEKDPHDSRLIEEGKLVKLAGQEEAAPEPEPPAEPASTGTGKDAKKGKGK